MPSIKWPANFRGQTPELVNSLLLSDAVRGRNQKEISTVDYDTDMLDHVSTMKIWATIKKRTQS
jgi:hypothetical protein